MLYDECFCVHSMVTLFAKFLGLSIACPFKFAT